MSGSAAHVYLDTRFPDLVKSNNLVNKHFNKLDRSIKIEKMKEKVIHFIK
jgi:hypothetical protein